MPAKGFRYPIAERFQAFVQVAKSGCHEWQGQKNRGYGVFKVGGRRDKAHRVAYELNVAPLQKYQCVLHRCDNPACVNPEHLFVGSKGDNNHDRHAKGRSRNQHTGKLVADQDGVR